MYLLRRIIENTSVAKQSATIHVTQVIHPDLNHLIECATRIGTCTIQGGIHRDVITKTPNQSTYQGCVFMINSSDRYHDGDSGSYARRMRIAIYNIDKGYSPGIERAEMCKYIICGDPWDVARVFNTIK
jgi:hypothetical protein